MKRSKENYHESHILIVGAGIIGKFNALELSRLGYQITIIDPDHHKNASYSSLGILMGNIYQKRSGRSWILRKESIELWPKWIKFLKEFNKELKIETPLVQLTTNHIKFERLKKFVNENTKQGLEILKEKSIILESIQNAFHTKDIQGIISYKDGRIDSRTLLESLNICLKNKKIDFIKDEVIKIKKTSKEWITSCKNNNQIKSDVIILCNSLNSLNLINKKIHKIGLKPVLGQAIEIYTNEKEIDLLSLPKHFNINGINILPITKNKIIIGSTDEYDIKPEKDVFEKLTNFIEKNPSWLNKENIKNQWYGVRSQPIGEPSPILKSLEKGLILCTGFYKNGILLAPACSNWISNEIKEHLI